MHEGSQLARWKRWENSEAARSERWDGREVARWQGGKAGRVVRWQGGRFLVLFEGEGRRVSPTFHLFISDVNQGNEGPGCVQDILAWPHGWRDSP